MKLKFKTCIENPHYLKSLHYNNIKVLNYKKTRYKRVKLTKFIKEYYNRQIKIIKNINFLSRYIRKNKVFLPEDIDCGVKAVLKKWVFEMDDLLSKTYYTTLNVKRVEEQIYRQIQKQYPELTDQLLSLSCGSSGFVLKLIKEKEYIKKENRDFVNMFFGGNCKLAELVINKDLDMAHIERIAENLIKKAKIKRRLIKNCPKLKYLDTLLIIDNVLEAWIWKLSWFTAPMWHTYNLLQEKMNPSGSIIKNKYCFDIKKIKDNL